MNERGVILISVLALLLTLSLLWTSLSVRLHQITTVTTTLINKTQAQAYLTIAEPTIRDALSNHIYPPKKIENRIKNPFTITIQLIDAQSKPNLNHYVDEEQKQLLTHAMIHCQLTKKIPYLIPLISHNVEQSKLYQSVSLEALLSKASIPQKKSRCLVDAFYALPEETTTININTATALTLALLAPTADASLIHGFVEQQQQRPFTTRGSVNNNYYLGNTLEKYGNLSLVSDYFYSIVTLKNEKKSMSYKTLWHREFDPQHTYLQKLWTIEV